MPELPEVETTKRGITPFLVNQTILSVTVRHTQLRLPVPLELKTLSINQLIKSVSRRAKYILIELSNGFLINHLGMSGHLRIVKANTPAGKHDHLDFNLSNGYVLRYNDPRRFGLWLYISSDPTHHSLFAHLGPEPLSKDFNADYFLQKAQGKTQSIKSFIMNNELVVGVGNIYATESLFFAGIHPQTASGQLTKHQASLLVEAIKKILQQAIEVGGTTMRDFFAFDGKPGYFANKLQAYGRKGLPCFRCNFLIEAIKIGGRNSAFCPHCQPKRNFPKHSEQS